MTKQTEDDYEYDDLLSLWSDLESGLGIVLGSPGSIQEFEQRIWQYDRWMQSLLKHDTDVGLYLLFQLASNSFVGYSASHALVSAVLCHLIAVDLQLPVTERDSLVHAALTMNIAMTGLQDHLARQVEKLSTAQQIAIRGHAAKGALMLSNMGIIDELWLDTVSLHHEENLGHGELRCLPAVRRLALVLRTVDRYGAMISPRKSREGQSATDALRTLYNSKQVQANDEVGLALIRTVGTFPPGTYVRLDNDSVALVKHRGSDPDLPDVAIVISKTGQPITPPSLHRTATGSPSIKAALTASAIQVNINHKLVLNLSDESV